MVCTNILLPQNSKPTLKEFLHFIIMYIIFLVTPYPVVEKEIFKKVNTCIKSAHNINFMSMYTAPPY